MSERLSSSLKKARRVVLVATLTTILAACLAALYSSRAGAQGRTSAQRPAAPTTTTNARGGVRTPPQTQVRPVVRTADRFDVSRPLRTMRPRPAAVEVEKGEDDRGVPGPVGDTRHDPDPVLQTTMGEGVFSPNAQTEIPAPSVSFAGMFNPPGPTGPVPPDPVGDIGPNHYVQMVNSRFQIFTRDGTSAFGPANINTLFTGFGGACETENAGDPVALYDQFADRWILMQFTSAGPTYFNCIAVSTTGDPTGSYYRYAVSTGANFPDYPKMAVWPDAYYISTREFLNGAAFAGVGAYAMERERVLRGDPAARIVSFLVAPLPGPLPSPIPPTGPQPMYRIGDGLLPSDLDGTRLPPAGQPNFFVGSMDNGASYGAPQDALNIFEFHVDWTNTALSTFTFKAEVPIAPYDTVYPCSGGATPSRNCIPQPGTTVRIDILSYRQRPLHRLAYRNFGTHESLVTNQAVEASPALAGTRWWELRDPHGTPTIHQEGTYAPDAVHRWMGSASMDHDGNIGLAYSVSDATSVFPGIRYTGRLSTDPLGTLPQGEGTLVAGAGSQTSTSSRWGDYSSLNVDPNNDCNLWITNEYYATTSARGWSTRIGYFRFPTCNAPAVPNLAAGQLIISEFRLRGPSGSMDEYIELYNPSTSALTVKTADGVGAAVVSSDAPTLAKCVVPEGTVIPGRGHFLCANTASPSPGAPPAYSLMNYPAGPGATATPDANILSDIPDTAGLALFSTTNVAGFVAGNLIDAVGPNTLPGGSIFREGTGLIPPPTTNLDYAYYRDACGKGGSVTQVGGCPQVGLPKDTGNNAADFTYVDTSGDPSTGQQRLGAPGPENLSSPVLRNAAMPGYLLDITKGASSAPNRVRDFTPGPGSTSQQGTLELRRRILNATGQPVTRLRFRIIDITTYPSAAIAPGYADLRAVTSTDTVVSNIADSNTCGAPQTPPSSSATPPCTVTVHGTALEEPPTQPNGGGFNATYTVSLPVALAPGESINVRWVLGVMASGTFKFAVNIEALP